jgi:putative MATE family efflux protein
MQDNITTTNKTSVFSFIKQAFKGEHYDFTQGSIRKAVLLLAIPMVVEMLMESVFALVDIFFVGRTANAQQAVSAVVLTESVLTILYSAAIALSMGATAIVARRVGEKNIEEAAHSGAQAITLGLVFTGVVGITGAFFAKDILLLMGASPQVIEEGTTYTRIIFGGSMIITLLFLINGIFRGAGNAFIAMWSLIIANSFNIVLCPILIHFYGLKGAAIATTIGRGTGVLYQLYHLLKGKGLLRLRRQHFHIDWSIMKNLFSISWIGFLQFFIGSASWIFMVRIMAQFKDDAAVAGYGLAIRVLMFFLLPAWGMSNAAATLVGQNLGAGQPLRAEQSVWKTAKYNAIFMALVTVIFVVFAGPIIQFMNKDVAVEKYATMALRTISLGYVFFGVGMVITSAFNGAGDTKTPMFINLVCFWAMQIPLAYMLAVSLHWGPSGVFYAILITETTLTLVSIVIFRRGAWKKVKV